MRESDATALGSTETLSINGNSVECAGGAGAAPRDRCARAEWRVVCAGFPTTRGRSQHERLVHPEWYHGIRISLVSSRK